MNVLLFFNSYYPVYFFDCDCLHLHHDRPPSCGNLSLYIWEDKNSQLLTCRNTAKIVAGLTVVFLISYVLYHALWAYKICTEEVEIYYAKITFIILYLNYKFLYLISTYFLLINSRLNSVALFCTSSPFGQYLKRYLTWFCKTNSPLLISNLQEEIEFLTTVFIFFSYN
jgi:hypothetical protein